MKILVIDDAQINHKLAKFHLEKEPEVSVESALNGMDGIEMAITGMPDMILLDVAMPELDGKETLRTLKKIKLTKHIPVIMAGTDNDMNLKEKLLAMGASDFIRKSHELPQLFNRLKAQLDVNRQPA